MCSRSLAQAREKGHDIFLPIAFIAREGQTHSQPLGIVIIHLRVSIATVLGQTDFASVQRQRVKSELLNGKRGQNSQILCFERTGIQKTNAEQKKKNT